MARYKQTAQRKPKTTSGQRIEVDAGEVTFPDGVQRTGKVTLVRFDVPDSPTEVRISSPQEDIGVNEYPSSSRSYRDHFSSSSSSSEDTELNAEDKKGNVRAKELGIVFYACKANAGFIELWWEQLRNKKLQKSILPMAGIDKSSLGGVGEGGVVDHGLNVDDVITEDALADSLNRLRSQLIKDGKSNSHVWWFIELCYNNQVEPTLIGRLPTSKLFKRVTDKKFDFHKYLASRGIKRLPSQQGSTVQSTGSRREEGTRIEETSRANVSSSSTSGGRTDHVHSGDSALLKGKQVVDATAGSDVTTSVVRVLANKPVPATIASSGAAQGIKRKAVTVEKHKGFNPEETTVGFEKEANVTMLMDTANTDEMEKVQLELSQWYPLGYDTLVWYRDIAIVISTLENYSDELQFEFVIGSFETLDESMLGDWHETPDDIVLIVKVRGSSSQSKSWKDIIPKKFLPLTLNFQRSSAKDVEFNPPITEWTTDLQESEPHKKERLQKNKKSALLKGNPKYEFCSGMAKGYVNPKGISNTFRQVAPFQVLGPTHALAKYVASWKASAKAPLDYSDNQSFEHDDGHPEVSSQHAEASPKDNRAEDPQPIEPSNPVPHFDLAEMNAPDPGFTRAGGGERSFKKH
ncbi:hypothetical protein R1sor_021664 [Riccia sorocarpa]|uniref:Uncharacterized protein n=1 Tax=Riccia sorocarpa TaxID=122646 RepID=A0ABD3GHQ6_9MARC